MNPKRHGALMTMMGVMLIPATNSQQALESLQLPPELTIHSELPCQAEQTAPVIVAPAKPTVNSPGSNKKQQVSHCATKHPKLHTIGMGLKRFMKVLLPIAQLAGAAATIVYTVHQFR
jgi:hypothetical protein